MKSTCERPPLPRDLDLQAMNATTWTIYQEYLNRIGNESAAAALTLADVMQSQADRVDTTAPIGRLRSEMSPVAYGSATEKLTTSAPDDISTPSKWGVSFAFAPKTWTPTFPTSNRAAATMTSTYSANCGYRDVSTVPHALAERAHYSAKCDAGYCPPACRSWRLSHLNFDRN